MKLNKFSMVLLAFAATTFVGCEHDDVENHHYENKMYITTEPVTDDLLIKADVTEAVRTISIRTAQPVDRDVTAHLEAHPEWAATYNMIYKDNAFALPEENFEIPETVMTIKSGSITGDDIVVNFKNTNELSGKYRYVLPVTIAQTDGIEVLESRRTVYFVFKGAALINVVADIRDCWFHIGWKGDAAEQVKDMATVTIEALLRSDNWGVNMIGTVFGIEGHFLVRIGDAGFPNDQIQLATGWGNWPSANAAPSLPVNEWVHIAIVYDTTTGDRIYYQNGEPVVEDKGARNHFRLDYKDGNPGDRPCCIGYSYDPNRFLPGEISEVRVWSVQRSQSDIKAHMYSVDPSTPGLLGYWKFNEGTGNIVKDATANGSNTVAHQGELGHGDKEANIKWVPVELPKFE